MAIETSAEYLVSKNLLYTERGIKWFEQFSYDDKELAERLVSSLTLISHSEFNRSIQNILENRISGFNYPSAFFAVREVEHGKSYFHEYTDPATGEISSLSSGSDHGSEARVAAMVRNICKTDPTSLKNHPSIEEMRESKCKTIILIDDFIGSGERVIEFLDSFLLNKTIRSWLSLKYMKFVVVTYSGTAKGLRRVKKHRSRPKIIIERDCPTFSEIPWKHTLYIDIRSFLKKYGKKTSAGYFWDGYGQALAAIVFEHGCPDNTPPIFWAPDDKHRPWFPLFPDRSILVSEGSVFPAAILKPEAKLTLLDVGQQKIANSGALSRRGEIGQNILIVLALIAMGQRKRVTISYATGLNKELCSRIIETCINFEFISRSLRLTKKGKAELDVARKYRKSDKSIPDIGDDCYYPFQLRGSTHG